MFAFRFMKDDGAKRFWMLTNRILNSDKSLWGWRFELAPTFNKLNAECPVPVIIDVPYDSKKGTYKLESYLDNFTLPSTTEAMRTGKSQPAIDVGDILSNLDDYIHVINGVNVVQHVYSAKPAFFSRVIETLANALYDTNLEEDISPFRVTSFVVWQHSVILSLTTHTPINQTPPSERDFEEAFKKRGFDDFKMTYKEYPSTGKYHPRSVSFTFVAASTVPTIPRKRAYHAAESQDWMGVILGKFKMGMLFSCSHEVSKRLTDVELPVPDNSMQGINGSNVSTSLDYLPVDGLKNTFAEIIRVESPSFIERHSKALQPALRHIVNNTPVLSEVFLEPPVLEFTEVKNVGFNHYKAIAKLGVIDDEWPFEIDETKETILQSINALGDISNFPIPPVFMTPVDKVVTSVDITEKEVSLVFDVLTTKR